MDATARLQVMSWTVDAALTGMPEADLVRGFCERCRAGGLPLSRGLLFMDTLHPIFEGRGYRWNDVETAEDDFFEYGSTSEGEAAANWQRSIFFHMLENGAREMCVDLHNTTFQFPQIETVIANGHRHVVVFVHPFGEHGSMGQMDCFYAYWATRDAQGFDTATLAALRDLVPLLGLAIKSASQVEIARTLGRVYLGRDAAAQVLSGRISRGVTERINAVLWFSDLRGSTAIGEAIGPGEIIPFLNDYAEASIAAIHEAGGDVLKLMGDGVLAMFTAPDMAAARRAALRAEHAYRKKLTALNAARGAANRPITTAYVGLHVGEVFYGNIGSDERLDFTVVGPAVNEVSRIASMCSSVDRALLLSSAFAEGLDPIGRDYLVSTGRYALRGIRQAQDLYTLDPGIALGDAVILDYEQYLAGYAEGAAATAL